MKKRALLPLTAFAFAVACSDSPTSTDPGAAFGKAGGTGNAHFQSASAAYMANNTVTSYFDIAGVGSDNLNVRTLVDYVLSYACVNGGGNVPTDAKKKNVNAQASGNQAFTPINGRVQGNVVVYPPTPNTGSLRCPGGQTSTFMGYTGIGGTAEITAYRAVDLVSTTVNIE